MTIAHEKHLHGNWHGFTNTTITHESNKYIPVVDRFRQEYVLTKKGQRFLTNHRGNVDPELTDLKELVTFWVTTGVNPGDRIDRYDPNQPYSFTNMVVRSSSRLSDIAEKRVAEIIRNRHVCAEWKADPAAFRKYLEDMPTILTEEYRVQRIDTRLPFQPGNIQIKPKQKRRTTLPKLEEAKLRQPTTWQEILSEDLPGGLQKKYMKKFGHMIRNKEPGYVCDEWLEGGELAFCSWLQGLDVDPRNDTVLIKDYDSMPIYRPANLKISRPPRA